MKRIIVYLLLGIVFLAASWTLLSPQFFRVHDYTHGARISEMTRALEEGHFPVRWTENFGYGYGMPLFEFYAPLPYYVGSLIYWISANIILSIKMLFIISTLGTVIGGYLLGKNLYPYKSDLTADLVGITTAAAITLAPYRAVNLFVRGALSEAWAIMALPWILLGIVSVIQKKKNAWVLLVASLVVLFLSHNLTTMLFLPLSLFFFAIYGLVQLVDKSKVYIVKKKISWKAVLDTVLTGAGSYLLAVSLSAFYLVPTFFEKDYTKVERYVLDAYFNFRLHFLYIRQFLQPNWGFGGSAWGVDDDMSFFLGYGQIIGAVVLGFLTLRELVDLYKDKKRRNLGKLILIVSLFSLFIFSLFMSILKSQTIWELLSLLEFVQFPWRWLSVSLVFLGVLAGFSVSLVRTKNYQTIFAGILITFILLGNFIYFKPEKYLSNAADYYYTDEEKIRVAMSDILQDYIPTEVPEKIPPSTALFTPSESGEEIFSVLVDRTHEKLVRTNFSSDGTAVFQVAQFPGWYVELDGVKVDSDKTETGLIKTNIPQGSHLVALKFGYTEIRKISDMVSFLALLICIALLIETKKKNEKKK